MSTLATFTLWCNDAACAMKESFRSTYFSSPEEARRRAAAAGWTQRGELDYCPDHSATPDLSQE